MSDCIFCKIIKGEIPSKKLYEDDDMVAFFDVNPQAPIHFLVIPKRHIPSVMETNSDDAYLLGRLLYTAQHLAQEAGCDQKGMRIVINCKEDGGQTVDHLHVHVLGGRQMDWPPG